MEFLDIPIFSDDFFKMMFRLFINLTFLTIIIRFIYYPFSKRKDFVFTYYLISLIVFFLCFALKKFEMDLGMALGLFAIFGILRYRTDAISQKEVTYLFVVIGISVINSLANKKMSYAEILGFNTIIVLVLVLIERYWSLKQEESKSIIYENIENIKPENYAILKSDLESRTGLIINRITIGEVNFLRDTAKVTIFYFNGNQEISN
ncbi:uncharacterized protein DUF4956 [Mariniflexile fucanivorans]|uniref:Uncharacterized protein DUF4956 n=1 Tax=Mariniflexile fucanivorans TaxID=264023 RepID=A0A4R1RET1_9FLAO|nr:DUF4956 domain-containing protein [Mariniflexile fucanivorans]TCL64433.1 uncharacterized protein DUF4956 [Mariniflexile fucanivorans]